MTRDESKICEGSEELLHIYSLVLQSIEPHGTKHEIRNSIWGQGLEMAPDVISGDQTHRRGTVPCFME